ncbi:MAG: ferrous iron transport protein B, partial [Bdellovibrionota bacterium]
MGDMNETATFAIPIAASSGSATGSPTVALAGNPNCGKTALFNAITRGRQKVGNYPGVTVEWKEGSVKAPSGTKFTILDLPGTYSLDARTPDESVARDVLLGVQKAEATTHPEAVIAVADATNLERSLGLVLELKELGMPVVLALNMMDLARKRGLELDVDVLSRELNIMVVPTVAIKRQGIDELLRQVEKLLSKPVQISHGFIASGADDIRKRFAEIDRILKAAIKRSAAPTVWTDRIDRVVLHPLWGSLFLVLVLCMVFQAIFSWASLPMDLIRTGIVALGSGVEGVIPEGALRSLIVDGVFAGVGSVLVFLPQIVLLFFFILVLEDSGYMARAAFLMDRVMGRVGLHGRAFIPLLSSFACAIPGIMATRTIENRKDRLITILIAPLMTCSARLPVYLLLIGAFIPNVVIFGPFRLQGLVMFGLYFAGIIAALAMAVVFRKTLFRGEKPPLLMELPTYKWPSPRSIFIGLLERAGVFVRRAGTVILALSMLLWFLASYPKLPPKLAEAQQGGGQTAISYSYAGRIGQTLAPVFEPIGFNWKMTVALIPGFAAREVMVSALGTVYALEGKDEGVEIGDVLGPKLAKD